MDNISNKQRNFAYAMMRNIAEHTGYEKNEYPTACNVIKETYRDTTGHNLTLSNKCTKDDFNIFMAWLLDLYFYLDSNSKECIKKYFLSDLGKYFLICIKHKRCAICGKPADIHHVDKIGMGLDRNKVDHSTYRRIALCRYHHTECHNAGETEFQNKYHVYGIRCKFHNKYDDSEEMFLQNN